MSETKAETHYGAQRAEELAAALKEDGVDARLAHIAAELRRDLGLRRRRARVDARRALLFDRDLAFHKQLLNTATPTELEGVLNSITARGEAPAPGRGVLLLTLHYSVYPILWLWLKREAVRARIPDFTLLYHSGEYRPDVPPEQYKRLADAGIVRPERGDLDLAVLDTDVVMRGAVERLTAGGSVLIFADAYAIPNDRKDAIVCRVGTLTIAYPPGCVRVARESGADVQGVFIRPDGDALSIAWGPRVDGPADLAAITEIVQELLDESVGRDAAAWQTWEA